MKKQVDIPFLKLLYRSADTGAGGFFYCEKDLLNPSEKIKMNCEQWEKK